MVYTLPRAIKEEKKNEEGVGSLESTKREQGWQIVRKVKKRNERGGSEGFDFLFFISVQGSADREYLKRRRGRFSFFVKPGESTERVRVVSRGFHLGRERLGFRGPLWSFFSLMYVSLFAHLMDLVNERCV